MPPLRAISQQILIGIRLNFRNRMALLYGYLFPTIFLIAFRTLYREDRVPLVMHAGELLTVTILGGACFGLPTGLVSDRERGVWRRYKMLPVSSFGILGGTLVTRYLLLLTAGLLQLLLAMAIGMPAPQHPFALFAAFSIAAVAFMGIGLDIAMLAANVPAVQALGQCLFLPMLIVGGIAVPLDNLPSWAQHLSAFLPGRYAVEAIQAAVAPGTIGTTRFDLFALLLIGIAGAAAGLLAFRWDSRQRPNPWIALALTGCITAGIYADARGVVHTEKIQREAQHEATEYLPPPTPTPTPTTTVSAPTSKPLHTPSDWQDVTAKDIAGVAFDRLPEDTGVIAPIAADTDDPDQSIIPQLNQLRAALPTWQPGRNPDPVQRVRNLLYAASVPDVYRIDPLERFVPLAVFDQIEETVPGFDLAKVLYFIALHPNDGSDDAIHELHTLGLPDGPPDTRTLRNRTMIYAFKLLGRVTSHTISK